MSETPPSLETPTSEEIEALAARHHLSLSDEAIEDFEALIAEMIPFFERLDELPDSNPLRPAGSREPGRQPTEEEDPYNAFVTKCRIGGSNEGPLHGYDVGVKDNIAVAGVRMTCGTRPLTDYVPSGDATVVTRLLEAGATIVGKTNMEAMAFSSSGELSATGPILNPVDPGHLAGGSSGGSAAAVAAGDVDVALGTDQAGSIRIPAAWCGVVGLKPTFGLIPYTGIVGQGYTFDHVGPIASSVEDCAKTLDVIAGADELDPRPGPSTADGYMGALPGSVSELTIGVVEEGFEHPASDGEVDRSVRDGLAELESDGAEIREISIPWHHDGPPIWIGVMTETIAAVVKSEGVGHFVRGHYDSEYARAFAAARRTRADEFPPTLKLSLVLGEYLTEHYRGRYHIKAQNSRRELAKAYDEALADVDVLALPTTPQTAFEAESGLTRREEIDRAFTQIENTAPFDMTGHPAITLPCGRADGLPVGLMLVGKRNDDAALLRASHGVESVLD